MKPLRKQDTTIIWSEENNAFLASCAHFICHGDSRQEALKYLEETIEFSSKINDAARKLAQGLETDPATWTREYSEELIKLDRFLKTGTLTENDPTLSANDQTT